MIRKFLNRSNQAECAKKVQQILDDIKDKEMEIEAEKLKIKEEHANGSRLTKHRFTL
ncbi:hypothetical protein QVN83_17095 [Yersinia frederiksenii]|uniref:hypothetical protein n=1 Tax=Yersinia frederiksenii TaxID=29484 RepID=UPI0025AA8CF1|nr:hypothetical protein [Yersinia frederiksenii]MDN0120679.1 hypothetical protein [Yersinia frederiksenii]